MEQIEYTDEHGRKYQAMQDGEARVILGPPEGLVDELNLPEPFATNLHNALFARGIFTFGDYSKNPKSLLGALMETYAVDQQNLSEALFRFSHEEVSP